MGRTGNIEEVRSENRRPSILSILIITIVLVAGAVSSVMFAYNLTKQSNSKAEAQKVKDEVVEQVIADIENSYDTKKEKEPEVTFKTEEQIKEENGDFTEEYKKYEELTDKQKEESEVIPRKFEVEYEELEEIKEKQEEENENIEKEKIPSSFDLRDKIQIEVRNQGSYGICWDYTLTKCIETNIALKTGKYYDLSEMYVDYTLSSECTNGNYFRRLHDGGSGDYIGDIKGMILECDFPYGEYSVNEYKDTIEQLKPLFYINDYVEFPSNHGETDEEKKQFRDTVKRHIMNYGSLYCSIASPQPNAEYVSGSNVYYKGDEKVEGYHAVSIIGWDDNYSKDNFNGKYKPSKNGAYIAVNSWGYDVQEVLYISYEDKLVEGEMVGVIDVGTQKTEENYRVIKFESPNLYEQFVNNFAYKLEEWNDDTLEIKVKIQELDSFTYLALNNLDINSLKGLEYFTNLKNVSINNCNVKDISCLSEFKNLETLSLSDNKIEDFSPIYNLTNIKNLSISNNQINDISFVKNYSNLISLTLNNCSLKNEDIKNIHDLKNLVLLGLADNDIEDISFLSGFNNLASLDLSGNKKVINNINKIPKNVECLMLNNCGITDLKFIEKFDSLRALQLSNNDIKSVKELEKFNNLYTLNLSNNNIEDFGILKIDGFLNLSQCNINSLNDIAKYECSSLLLENNKIETIDVQDVNNTIAFLNLSNNPIKSLEGIEKFENLRNINLTNCEVTDVSSLKNVPNLYFVTLDENPGVTGYAQLKLNDLSLKKCQLDNNSEVLSAKTIRSIDIRDNNITYVDPSIYDSENMYTLYIDNKVVNSTELFHKAKELNKSLKCENVTEDVYITLPSAEKLYLFKDDSSIISRDLTDGVNCELDSRCIILNTQNQNNIEFSFKEKTYDSTITYIYHCTIDPYFEVEGIKPISNKINNKMIYETKEKNFDIVKVEVDYGSINGLRAISYTTNYYLNDENLQLTDEYAVLSVGYDSAYVYLDIFSSEDMKKIDVEDLYDFTLALETLKYNNVYDVDYENRNFITSTSKVKPTDTLLIKREFKDKELYKLFKNVNGVEMRVNGLKTMDISFLKEFDNLSYVYLDGIVPLSIKEYLDKGIVMSCFDYVYDEYIDTVFADDIFKLEGERLYLPIVLNEFDSENYEISVEYVLSEKVDQNDRIGMYEDYTEPKVYIEKYEYNYDENISRYYIDGVRLDKDKTVFLTVNVYGEGINQMLFGFSY